MQNAHPNLGVISKQKPYSVLSNLYITGQTETVTCQMLLGGDS